MTTAPDPADEAALAAYLAPPPDLSPAALDLWHRHLDLLAEVDAIPTPTEHRLLSDAVRSATLADSLADALATEGYTVPGARGVPRPHPLLLELDRARRTTAALLKQLGQGDRATSSAANGAARWQPRGARVAGGGLR